MGSSHSTVKVSAFDKFVPFLKDLTNDVKTPCEGFTAMQLGPFTERITDGKDQTVGAALVLLDSGAKHPQHQHKKSSATLYFISGSGYVILGEEKIPVPYKKGSVVFVGRGMLHGFDVREGGAILSIQEGGSIIDTDGKVDIHYPKNPECANSVAGII